MLPRICAGSPKAMQQVDIVQSRMSLRCSRGTCNYILAPSCAHFATREESQHYFFLFSAPSLCPQWRACEVPHEPSLLERKVFFYFSVHISVIQLPQLFYSTEFILSVFLLFNFLSYFIALSLFCPFFLSPAFSKKSGGT